MQVIAGGNDDLVVHRPFDLRPRRRAFAGNGPGGSPLDPREALRPAGTLVIDDMFPTQWPPQRFEGGDDHSRVHWLEHPALLTTEILVHPEWSALVTRLRP